MSYRDQIAEGMRLLDENGPENWREKVNIEKLDMGEPELQGGCGCILAQLYGDYVTGRQALGIRRGGGTPYGFDCSYDDEKGLVYGPLTEEWKEALKS
jgi:hypothetical protein